MIIGCVTAQLEARIRLTLEDGTGQPHVMDATIDTGFSEYLTLPSALVRTLALPRITWRQITLGDGTMVPMDVHSAVVIWDAQPRAIEVHAVEGDPLVGMKMLAGHELRIRVVDGGLVWIDIVP